MKCLIQKGFPGLPSGSHVNMFTVARRGGDSYTCYFGNSELSQVLLNTILADCQSFMSEITEIKLTVGKGEKPVEKCIPIVQEEPLIGAMLRALYFAKAELSSKSEEGWKECSDVLECYQNLPMYAEIMKHANFMYGFASIPQSLLLQLRALCDRETLKKGLKETLVYLLQPSANSTFAIAT